MVIKQIEMMVPMEWQDQMVAAARKCGALGKCEITNYTKKYRNMLIEINFKNLYRNRSVKICEKFSILLLRFAQNPPMTYALRPSTTSSVITMKILTISSSLNRFSKSKGTSSNASLNGGRNSFNRSCENSAKLLTSFTFT